MQMVLFERPFVSSTFWVCGVSSVFFLFTDGTGGGCESETIKVPLIFLLGSLRVTFHSKMKITLQKKEYFVSHHVLITVQ